MDDAFTSAIESISQDSVSDSNSTYAGNANSAAIDCTEAGLNKSCIGDILISQ